MNPIPIKNGKLSQKELLLIPLFQHLDRRDKSNPSLSGGIPQAPISSHFSSTDTTTTDGC